MLTLAQQIAFGRCFGEPETFPQHRSQPADYPEIFRVSNVESRGYPNTSHHWHTDGCTRLDPPAASLLYPVEIPEEGGGTLFLNLYESYANLPEGMKQRVQELRAVHSNRLMRPLVVCHPVTKRKALHISPDIAVGIDGLPSEEGLQLLDALSDHLNSHPEFVYQHKWRPGDLVIWDNTSVAHQAGYIDPAYPRTLNRITIKTELHTYLLVAEGEHND